MTKFNKNGVEIVDLLLIVNFMPSHKFLSSVSICVWTLKRKTNKNDIISEPPPTPQNLSILDIQSRSVKVAWSVEAASPAVDRLVVQWKEQAGKQSYFLTFEWYALVVSGYAGLLGMFLFIFCLYG